MFYITSPRYATAWILTVNQRLLSAISRHSDRPQYVHSERPVWGAFGTFGFAMLRTSLTETFGQKRTFRKWQEWGISGQLNFHTNYVSAFEYSSLGATFASRSWKYSMNWTSNQCFRISRTSRGPSLPNKSTNALLQPSNSLESKAPSFS